MHPKPKKLRGPQWHQEKVAASIEEATLEQLWPQQTEGATPQLTWEGLGNNYANPGTSCWFPIG